MTEKSQEQFKERPWDMLQQVDPTMVKVCKNTWQQLPTNTYPSWQTEVC